MFGFVFNSWSLYPTLKKNNKKKKIRKAPAKARSEILPMSIPDGALSGKNYLPLCTNCQRKLLLFLLIVISSLQTILCSHTDLDGGLKTSYLYTCPAWGAKCSFPEQVQDSSCALLPQHTRFFCLFFLSVSSRQGEKCNVGTLHCWGLSNIRQ